MSGRFHFFRGWLAGAVLLAGGCASLSPDAGRRQVEQLVAERGYPVDERTEALLTELTSAPLTAASSVRIALLNNPELQSSYARLGFAVADVYEAVRLRNPVLSRIALHPDGNHADEQITLGLVASFTDLLTLRARSRLARGAYTALRQETGARVLEVATEAEKAYYRYAGARQVAALRREVAKAGALSAALAKRFREAGNLSARELAMELALASEARLASLEAAAAVLAARTELAALLGLSTGDAWRISADLHLPPDAEIELSALLALAETQNLRLAAAKSTLELLIERRGLAGWARWLGEFELGVERERETDGARSIGPVFSWELPVFNQHRDELLRADVEVQTAANHLRRVGLDIDNRVRLAHAAVENARARVDEYLHELIPRRSETVARTQEEVNFMLTGVFELMALKQEEYDAYQSCFEAVRDYWLARAELAFAVGASLPDAAGAAGEGIRVEEFIRPAKAGGHHAGRGAHRNPANRPETKEAPNEPAPSDEHVHHHLQAGDAK